MWHPIRLSLAYAVILFTDRNKKKETKKVGGSKWEVVPPIDCISIKGKSNNDKRRAGEKSSNEKK